MPETCVYVIRDARGDRKIGITGEIRQRFSDLQCAHSEELAVEYLFTLDTKESARQVEKLAHKSLKLMGMHKRGEWFNVAPLFAHKVIVEAASQLKLNIVVSLDSPDTDDDVSDDDLAAVLSRLYGSSEKMCIICSERAEYRYSGEQAGEKIREGQRWLCCEHSKPYRHDKEWQHLPDQVVPAEE